MKPVRFLVAILAVVLTGVGVAQAAPPANHNCLGFDGGNVNELLGITERIIGPPACREALAGERWVRLPPPWITAASGEGAVYPPDYTPARFNPIDDFNQKFVGARFVQDIGTVRARTFTFGREVLRTGFELDGLPTSYFPSRPLQPLNVGWHTATVFITLSAMHCDGSAPNVDENCIPAGEVQWTGDLPFEVLRRHR